MTSAISSQGHAAIEACYAIAAFTSEPEELGVNGSVTNVHKLLWHSSEVSWQVALSPWVALIGCVCDTGDRLQILRVCDKGYSAGWSINCCCCREQGSSVAMLMLPCVAEQFPPKNKKAEVIF